MQLTVGKLVCYFQKITDMNRLPLGYSSAHNIASADTWSIPTRRDLPIMGDKPNHVTIKAADNSVVCLTQPCRGLCDHIQHRLNIRGRTSDDSQDFTRGSLSFQRLL